MEYGRLGDLHESHHKAVFGWLTFRSYGALKIMIPEEVINRIEHRWHRSKRLHGFFICDHLLKSVLIFQPVGIHWLDAEFKPYFLWMASLASSLKAVAKMAVVRILNLRISRRIIEVVCNKSTNPGSSVFLFPSAFLACEILLWSGDSAQ